MEASEKDKIIKVLPNLLEDTHCNVMLTAELLSKGVISSAEERKLNVKSDDIERNMLLFSILQTRVNGYKHFVRSLQLTNQTGVLQLLGELEVSKPKRESPFQAMNTSLFFNVYPPSQLFTGRSSELQKLAGMLIAHREESKTSQVYSVTGLGGVGKSELVKMFVNQIKQKSTDLSYNCIVWIDAETHFSLARDFKILAKDKLSINTLDSNGGEKDILSVLDDIYNVLNSQLSLVIFDNVENYNFIEKYLPKFTSQIAFIVTSQDTKWDSDRQINLSGLAKADAVEFVMTCLKPTNTLNKKKEDEVCDLVTRLNTFPLALNQAVAYIQDKQLLDDQYGPATYLKDLDSVAVILFSNPITGNFSSYTKTIFQTVEVALAKIISDLRYGSVATQIVNLMAFMAPENITVSVFHSQFDQTDISGSLLLLKRYSLVDISPRKLGSALTINVHRLVQEILRNKLVLDGTNENHLTEVLNLINNKVTLQTLSHALSIWKHTEKYDNLVILFASLPSQIIRQMFNAGLINEAYDFSQNELKRLQNLISYQENAALLIELERLIGFLIKQQSKLNESKTYFENLLVKAVNYLDKTHPVITNIRFDLAVSLFNMGHLEEALGVYLEVFQNLKLELQGKYDRRCLMVMQNIGMLQRRLKMYAEACTVFENVIQFSNELEGWPICEIVYQARCHLAVTKGFMGNPESALADLQELYEECLTNFSKNKTLLLLVENWLGSYQLWLGHFDKSVETHNRVYKIMSEKYGEDHRETLNVRLKIIEATSKAEEMDDAFSEAYRIFHSFIQIYGKEHYFTIYAYVVTGRCLYHLNQIQECNSIMEKALQIENFAMKAVKQEVMLAKYYWVKSLEKLGRNEEALAFLKRTKEDIKSKELLHIEKCMLAEYDKLNILTVGFSKVKL